MKASSKDEPWVFIVLHMMLPGVLVSSGFWIGQKTPSFGKGPFSVCPSPAHEGCCTHARLVLTFASLAGYASIIAPLQRSIYH